MGNNNTSIYTGSRSLNILLSAILLFLSAFGTAEAQYVTMSGGQFKLNGEDFYPVVMNYTLDIVYDNGINYLSPDHSYNVSNNYECNNYTSCCDQIKNDFNYIAQMGFNSIRIVGVAPKYSEAEGLFLDLHKFQLDGNRIHIPLNPTTPDDPGMALILSYYDKILEMADNTTPTPLKIILLVKEDATSLNEEEIELRKEFLNTLASHFASTSHASALLAYDLINEPCFHVVYPFKSKSEACNITRTWYDALKSNDPNHLVTIGLWIPDDIFSFDPAILKVDFISTHFYPGFKGFENRSDVAVQEKARKRVVNNLYWMQQITVSPWIIGETGFTASGLHDISEGLDGSLSDLGDYAKHTLKANCNCGGSGYSWWNYQDVSYADESDTIYFPKNFHGLLELGYPPSPEAEKQPAVDIFRHYTPLRTGNCPVDYSPTYDANKVYYNPYLYPPNPDKEVSATVTDQYGNPIKNAVVYVKVYMGKKRKYITPDSVVIVNVYDSYFTFTDENGFFKAIPYQYGIDTILTQETTNAPYISLIKVSASCSSVFIWWHPNDYSTIQLQRIENFDESVANETISTGQSHTYYGRNSLTVSNTVVESGGNAEFKSAREVRLLPGFHAKAGSNTHIFISPDQPDCNEYDFNNAKSKQKQ